MNAGSRPHTRSLAPLSAEREIGRSVSDMRLCWRVRLKSVLLVAMAGLCLAGLAFLQQQHHRSPSSAGEGGLNRGARGGAVERVIEKERELEAILAELKRTQKHDTESERLARGVDQTEEEREEKDIMEEKEREEREKREREEREEREREEREEREKEEREKREREEREEREIDGGRVVPRKALELTERESPTRKIETYQPGRRGMEGDVRDPALKARLERVKREQLRVSQERRQNQLPGERFAHGGREVRVWKEGQQLADNEEGFPHYFHFLVDLGEFGPAGYLSGQLLGEGENEMKRFQFNQLRSQQTEYDRELKDVRNPSCGGSREDYQSDLPAASVIICFHNEARSALLRTIYSVLHRSPPELLTEIILVDDSSDNPEDGQLLEAIPKVRLLRLAGRSGLMRARVQGAELARGAVLMFLDSHCEVTLGWLQPLLSRIKTNHTHVVSPVIDIINKDSMQYTSASPLVKGGFGHNLHFRWDQMSQKEMQSRARMIDPIRTPAIAGGLFAVERAWFEHLGMYDTQMEIWGGENIELSLRVWMCGGVLEIIPCSRVGHIFRSAMPYSFGPGGTYQTTVAKNIRRTVEVWLDEYRPFFHEQNPFSREVEFGDISERLALRERLQCKPFSWYLKKIYPQFDPPPIQDFTYGQLRHGGGCLETLGRHSMTAPELRPCDPHNAGLGGSQGWAVTRDHQVKTHPLCLTSDSGKLVMKTCNGGTKQLFHLHGNGVIQHGPTNSCLTAAGPRLHLEPCDVTNPAQIWEFVVATTPTKSRNL